jgi:hypothetical protein
MAWPPICAKPASKETRVRVEDFSKIIARTLFLKISGEVPARCMALSSMARWMMLFNSSRDTSSSVKKCLGAFWGTMMLYSFLSRVCRRCVHAGVIGSAALVCNAGRPAFF